MGHFGEPPNVGFIEEAFDEDGVGAFSRLLTSAVSVRPSFWEKEGAFFSVPPLPLPLPPDEINPGPEEAEFWDAIIAARPILPPLPRRFCGTGAAEDELTGFIG